MDKPPHLPSSLPPSNLPSSNLPPSNSLPSNSPPAKLLRGKVSLRNRLLLSQLAVLAVTVIALAAVSRLYVPRYVVLTLERMERRGFIQRQIRVPLSQAFEGAWSQGVKWSIVLGGATAGGLSYWLSRRIARPLLRMENATRQFAAGDFSARVPPLDIPEFDRLGHGFNRMANDLEGVEQRRRELVGDLSHELRTPLTIIRGYLEGMADGAVEATPEMYGRLAQETERLQRLVDDLQELSKLESGYLPIESQAVDVGPLVQLVGDRFADQLIGQDTLTLSIEASEKIPKVWGDPARIEQVLVNLLSNALRHTPSGEVRVKVRAQKGREKDYVWIDVSDTGAGISAEDLPHVFERFWRADRSRDRTSGGSGIGLAICRRLVELQGGQISATSQLHQGSTFSFSLPTYHAL